MVYCGHGSGGHRDGSGRAGEWCCKIHVYNGELALVSLGVRVRVRVCADHAVYIVLAEYPQYHLPNNVAAIRKNEELCTPVLDAGDELPVQRTLPLP